MPLSAANYDEQKSDRRVDTLSSVMKAALLFGTVIGALSISKRRLMFDPVEVVGGES